MNPIAEAIHDVAEGKVERICQPGLWSVFLRGRFVMFENIALGQGAFVVTTLTKNETAED